MARRGGKSKKRKTGLREKNGRLSRKKEEVAARKEIEKKEAVEDARKVVIDARKRHLGLPEEYLDLHDAGRPNAGTVQGVLRLRGRITAEQFTAAEWIIGRHGAYLRAIQSPGRCGGMEGPPGQGDEAKYERWCREARERWQDIVVCLAEASVATRSPLLSAVDTMLFRQQLMEHMEGDLRYALTAVDRAFMSTQVRAA